MEFKGRTLSPNILDLRIDSSPSTPLDNVLTAWRAKQTWNLATEVANRRKFLAKETSPTIVADRKALRDRALNNYFGDPMRIGKEEQ